MASLVSPGVQVTVTDDSSYATTGTGTVPLIIFGTQENKTTPSGSSATGTTASNAGKLYYLSSQRDVVQTFGTPYFETTTDGTAVDGGELNEYGLHALYQTTSLVPCYAIRADIDYAALVATTTEPRGEPADGTYWLNPVKTDWGIYQSNGSTDITSAWVSQTPTTITSSSDLELSLLSIIGFSDTTTAIATTDDVGDLVINNTTVSITAGMTLTDVVTAINSGTSTSNVTASAEYIAEKFYLKLTNTKISGTVTIDYVSGSTSASTLATITTLGFYDTTTSTVVTPIVRPLSSVGSNGDFAVVTFYTSNIIYQKVTAAVAGDASAALSSSIWYIVGSDEWVLAKQNSNSFTSTYSQKIPASSKSGDVWLNLSPNGAGLDFYLQVYDGTSGVWDSISVTVYQTLAEMLSANTSPTTGTVVAVSPYVVMSNNTSNIGTQSTVEATSNLLIYNGSYWTQLVYTASASEPTTEAEEGTLWYNDTFVVDIMINQSGNEWVGYQNYTGYTGTDPNGPLLAGSQPTTQSGGSALVTGDIWIDTSDTENYPLMYRYNSTKSTWIKINNADSITPAGIVFADARATNGDGSTLTADLLVSNFVDPDAPNPELYPDGTLLFNTRIGTGVVKEWHPYYFTREYGAITENGITTYTDYTSVGYTVGVETFPHLNDDGGRWVTISGNFSDGSPKMLRHAQRAIIVKALQAAINDNTDVLSDIYYYSLIATPGYPELIPSMVELSDNINNIAFVVGDTPSRMLPTSASISAVLAGTNVNPEFNITTSSAYLGIFYPWGKSVNYDGSDIVIPPSTMMLRTIINSDNVSYPWYPPAGYTRGLIDNASNVGYIDPTTGDYTVLIMNQSQRDILYTNNINPIAYMVNKGLVVYGQKTMYGSTTALDRINVARLLCYLKYKLNALAKPFLFELNTSSTRTSAKNTFDKFMSNLQSLNAVSEYIVICDTTINTSTTIAAHELWIDVAIVPSSSIEFIYIPIRVENPGTDLNSLY